MRSYLLVMGTLSLQLACGERVVPASETPAPPVVQSPTPSVPAMPEPPTVSDSTWSPDSAMVAWVASFARDSSELWIGYRDGRESVRVDVKSAFDDHIPPLHADLNFTLDGEWLVYRTPFYHVGDAVELVDLETFEVLDTGASALEIIHVPRGQYAGMLVLLQGRLIEDVGRVFQFWLYTPDVEPIRKIADEDGYDAWAAKHIPPP